MQTVTLRRQFVLHFRIQISGNVRSVDWQTITGVSVWRFRLLATVVRNVGAIYNVTVTTASNLTWCWQVCKNWKPLLWTSYCEMGRTTACLYQSLHWHRDLLSHGRWPGRPQNGDRTRLTTAEQARQNFRGAKIDSTLISNKWRVQTHSVLHRHPIYV